MQCSKKIKLIFFITIGVVAIAFFVIVYFHLFTVIPKGKQSFRYVNNHIVLESNYIFDTGASISLVYDGNNRQIPLSFVLVSDYHKRKAIKPLVFRSGRAPYNDFVNNFFCVVDTRFKNQNDSIIGIMGMNVIQRANWHFSFKDSTVEVLSLRDKINISDKAICWKYKGRLVPKISINIGEITLDHFLLDMGTNDIFAIEPQNINHVLNSHNFIRSVDTVTGLLSREMVSIFKFDNLLIDGETYQNISITEAPRNLVGLGFMRRFDHLFWDSKHKKVYLWND